MSRAAEAFAVRPHTGCGGGGSTEAHRTPGWRRIGVFGLVVLGGGLTNLGGLVWVLLFGFAFLWFAKFQ